MGSSALVLSTCCGVLSQLADIYDLIPSLTLAVLAGTFAFYTLVEGKQLSAPTAFAAIGWINNLQFPLAAMSNTITSFVDASISLRRLGELFRAEPADVSSMTQWVFVLLQLKGRRVTQETAAAPKVSLHRLQQQQQQPVPMSGWLDLDTLCGEQMDARGTAVVSVDTEDVGAAPPVELIDASFGWASREDDEGATKEQLQDASPGAVLSGVNLSCPRGTLTLVIGTVGSGKSTLIAGLVGEADRVAGTVRVQGSIAFAGQSPWVQNRTLRENVTFALPFRPAWFSTVVSACW